jgi:hypothetical protein
VSETKDFHIGDILSVTTGRLVSPRHIGGVYDILNWMTGENLMTHQLPRVSEECEPFLKAQHPDLSEVVVPDGVNSEESLLFWLAEMTERYGVTRPVSPLAPADHTHIDPFAEIKMIRPDMPIIGVEVP